VTIRPFSRVVPSESTSDGAGVKLRRSVGGRALDHLDPFLLFDEFRSDQPGDYIAGFPDHPHRGFETVTYMLAGRMEHQDHAGNRGNLVAGSIQWMTAGRGIVHSEMPQQEEGLMWGFQLWINLPASLKMSPPRYQDIPPEAVPSVNSEGTEVRVLAGEFGGVRGPVVGVVTEPIYLDVRINEGSEFSCDLPPGHSAFAYVIAGTVRSVAPDGKPGNLVVPAGQLAVLGDGDLARILPQDGPAHILLLAAQPIGEPIARYGPFVMNTEEELRQAFRDLERGTFTG